MSRTVENHRIRVTVTNQIWNSYRKPAERLARLEGTNPDQVQRGLILSDAMAKLGNQSEAKLLAGETINPTQVRDAAHQHLVIEYMTRPDIGYSLSQALSFLTSKRVIPQAVSAHLERAHAYAIGALEPQTTGVITAIAAQYSQERPNQSPSVDAHHEELTNLLQGADAAQEHAASITRELTEIFVNNHEHDLERRQRTGEMSGWQIETIGPMPNQIGLTR